MNEFWYWFDIFQFALAIYAWGVAVTGLLMLVLNFRTVKPMIQVPSEAPPEWPKVSLIAPARNEERHVEEAVRSLLALEYAPLQITIVNDRSTDRTGEILHRLAASHPQLKVVDITELPPGWLGKNHALHVAAQASEGDWLLFTDADVVFHPQTLKRAIAHALHGHRDHICAFPDLRSPSRLLGAVVITFAQMLILYTRPWQVRDPRNNAYLGVGAFNLVKTAAYREAGGHVAIRMRPDDDLKLGQLLKKHGFRCEVVNGMDSIAVEWYATLDEMICGLEKNSSAPLEYNGFAVLGSCVILFLAFVWPFIGMWTTYGLPQLMFSLTAGLLLLTNIYTAYQLRHSLWLGLLFPLSISIFIYIQIRALGLLWWYRGIHWRGTHYSMDELRSNKI